MPNRVLVGAFCGGPRATAGWPIFPAPRSHASMRLAALMSLLALGACQSAAPLVASASAPVAVDGDAAEWAGGIRPVPGEPGLSLGVRNDAASLAVVIVAGSERQARRLATGGLVLWLDPAGGTVRRAGVRFPVGLGGAAGAAAGSDDPSRDAALREAFRVGGGRLEVVRPRETRPSAAAGVAGVETAAAWTAAGLVVEIRLPLRGPAALALAGERTGAAVGLGLELAEAPRDANAPAAPSLTGRGRDGRVDYGADQSGRETAAPQDDPAAQAARTTTRWIGIALAE